MKLNIIQILLLTFLSGFGIVESLGTRILANRPIIYGFITGIIVGDWELGLYVGATLELMGLGIGTYGGASIPDYTTAAIVGTVFGSLSGKGLDFGLGVAVPVGLLMVQLDILARFSNSYFQKKMDAAAEKLDFKAVRKYNYLGAIPWGLSRALPVFIILFFGNDLLDVILKYMPQWLMDGFSVAAGLLPAVGIAILLRFLPMKDNFTYILIGFVLVAYLNVPMLGVAILGLALAYKKYKDDLKMKSIIHVPAQALRDRGGLLDNEYED